MSSQWSTAEMTGPRQTVRKKRATKKRKTLHRPRFYSRMRRISRESAMKHSKHTWGTTFLRCKVEKVGERDTMSKAFPVSFRFFSFVCFTPEQPSCSFQVSQQRKQLQR